MPPAPSPIRSNEPPARLLLLEETPPASPSLQDLLREGSHSFEIVLTRHLSEAANALAQRSFDAILLDLPQMDAAGLATLSRARELAPSTPVIVLDGRDDDETAMEAIARGAQDYLVRSQTSPRLLVRAIGHAIQRSRLQGALERDVAERKRLFAELSKARAELEQRVRERTRELRASEYRYRSLVELSPDAVAVIRDGMLIYINGAGRNLLGASAPEDIVSRGLMDFVHPLDRHKVMAKLVSVRKRGETTLGEFRLRRLDGEIRTVEARSARIPFPGGGAILTVARDITARQVAREELRQAESSLRETNELLERMFANVHLQLAYVDTRLHILRVNLAFAEYYHRDPAFFVGRELDLARHETLRGMLLQVLETGEPHAAPECTLSDRDEGGLPRYWDLHIQPVRDAAGYVSGAILSLLDVTERVEARARVEAERRRLFALLNMLPAYVILQRPDLSVRFVNEHFTEQFGQPDGLPCFGTLRHRKDACPRCPVQHILKSGRPAQWEWVSENDRAYHVWGYPFIDADGARYVLHLGVDITERKEMERRLLHISSEERRRIGNDLHDSLGQNLAGLSFLTHALYRRLESQLQPEAVQASEIVGLANECVAQARSLSRGLVPVPVSREGLMDALRDLANHVALLFHVRCEFLCPRPVLVENEEAALHLFRIAQEAANNAAKHAQCSAVTLRLEEPREGTLVLRVQDDGVGMPAETPNGRGMGLRIMRYRADLIGATLHIERIRKGGTRVTCVLSNEPPRQIVDARAS